jgi:hypothetical protein
MTYEEEQAALERMARFLDWLWHFLQSHCVERLEYPVEAGARGAWRPLVDPAAQQALRAAWQHFESDHALAGLQQRVRSMPRVQLIEHGLYGAQLNAKLRMVLVLLSRCDALWGAVDRSTPAQHLVEGWAVTVSPPVTAAERRPKQGGLTGMVKSIKELVTGVDVFAKSVFAAAGIGSGLEEIKELFGMSLDTPGE